MTGNIKFDQPFPSLTEDMKARVAASLGLQGHERILIAGSTHPGEEEMLLGVYRDLLEIIPELILILCPRHLDRLEQVESILQKEKWPWVRRTALSAEKPLLRGGMTDTPPVILLDTMGELMKLYSLGTLVFIGGSLVPVGGHNPLEPLWFGKCVLFGPHMFNFREISRLLIEASGAIQVKDRADLLFQANRLLQEEGTRKEIGERGRPGPSKPSRSHGEDPGGAPTAPLASSECGTRNAECQESGTIKSAMMENGIAYGIFLNCLLLTACCLLI